MSMSTMSTTDIAVIVGCVALAGFLLWRQFKWDHDNLFPEP